MFARFGRRLFCLAATVPIATAASINTNAYPDKWLHHKSGIEMKRLNGNCKLPNGDVLGRCNIYKDVDIKRNDNKRIDWDIDADHKHVSFQFKLDEKQSVIPDINRYHWISFIKRHKTDIDGNTMQECMNISPYLFHYRDDWYLNVPRTRDINKQTAFYDKYGLNNRGKDELEIFINPKGWYDPLRHNELTIECESYLVTQINNERYCVLFRVHWEKKFDIKHRKGHFQNIKSYEVNQMIYPLQSETKWIVGYTQPYSTDLRHTLFVDNRQISKVDAILTHYDKDGTEWFDRYTSPSKDIPVQNN